MNVHITPKAAPLELADLEDLVCRVHWMAQIAVDMMDDLDGHPDNKTKALHTVRATSELALELYGDFYEVLEGEATP